jgi:hypothetical protein
MPDRRLYALTIPEGSLTQADASSDQQQALQAILNSDVGNVESIATNPQERPFTVEYPDALADVRIAELQELARGLSQPIPYYGIDTATSEDGFYILSRASGGQIDPRSTAFGRFEGVLQQTGTLASHRIEVQTHATQVDHPFGNATSAPVGVPAAATHVRWVNRETEAKADPTVQATRSAEGGDVDIYDALLAPFDSPSIIYRLDHDESALVDPRCWDTRGEPDRVDDEGRLVHQRVFATSHEPVGALVLDNGRLRVTLDDQSNTLSAESYDSSTDTWSGVALGASDWELFATDIRTLGRAQVGARIEFRDPTQSPTAYHTLTAQLQRGALDVLWGSETPVPSGLATWLEPIAADHIYDPFGDVLAAPQGLISKREVA